ESGNVVIVDASGTRTTVPAGTSAAITDSAGNGYIVDKKGNIHSTTAEIAAKAGNREYNLALKFDASPNQAFGFDVKHNPLAVKYERLEGDNYASWKAVATARTEAVLAILEGTGFDKSKIRFEQAGVGIGHQASATTSMPNAFDLNVRGGADGIEEGLLALYTPPDTTQKEQVLGKMNVATYDEIQKTVIIVPVNGNKYPYSEANLRTQLNKIYGQAVVKWNVQMAPEGFVVPGIDPFDDGGSGLLSNYSPDMRKVVDAYNTDPAPDTYYLFLVKNPKAGKLAGYMPRSKEFGFIFTDQAGSEQAIIHTIAHELGHGSFNLRHTFAEEKYTIPQGSTDNLMDYTQAFGTKLYKHQWDQMRYPEIVVGLFEEDEAGALRFDSKWVENFLVNLRRAYFANSEFSIGRPPLSRGCYDLPKATVILPTTKTTYRNLKINQDVDCGKVINIKIGSASFTDEVIMVKNTQGDVKIIIDLKEAGSDRKSQVQSLYNFLFGKPAYVTLFVEGYTPVKTVDDILSKLETDNPKPPDVVEIEADHSGYWEGMDFQFSERLGGSGLRVYAKGHHPITTSNHNVDGDIKKSKLKFLNSLVSSAGAKGLFISRGVDGINTPSEICYHNESCVHLNTQPNAVGFSTRMENGRKAGINMVSELQRIGFDKASIKIDIVAHSMGFAYAQGIIETLKENSYKLGRYYILAPENPSSGVVNLNDFENNGEGVWHYGTNESVDKLWEQ
ncbi:MAG: hypothetical protein ACK5U1_08700, partial [Cyclobacteriaceae bacterium]